MFTSFSEIPGNYNLFLDYLYEYDNVKEFYNHDFRDTNNYVNQFQLISSTEKDSRDNLPDILLNQYKNFNPSQKTQKNISLLKNKKTLVVVTGQQLGILGGPLYTFYKIISAIKLSQYLTGKYKGYNFVPVFWLEGDDHDFDEVKWINLINEENNTIHLNYNDELPEEENRGNVGNIKFGKGIYDLIREFEKNLRQTEFTGGVIDLIKSIYKEGKTFKECFAEVLYHFFDAYGLVIFDPQDIEIKKLLIPIFKKELEDFRPHSEKLIIASARLEEVYHAQVKVRPINLFMNYEKGRYAIEPVEDSYRLKNKRIRYTKEELLSKIETNPEQFSPNVLLRPICQDYIFPTAFYVGGPAEVCYMAQALPLYEFFNLTPPVIYPRSSATIIEKNIISIIEKYNLSIKDLFHDKNKISDKIINDLSEINLNDEFEKVKEKVDSILHDLETLIEKIDTTTANLSSKYEQKIISYLEEFKIKTVESQKKKFETTIRQINRALNSILPNNNMQERELNYFYFANKYGLDLIKQLFEELEINKFEHQVIYL